MARELSYRRAAIGGASAIGLIIVLFDTLSGDLRRAASALRSNDIETRCNALNHAALVLGQLESWVDLKNGGDSAQTLSRFYAYLRSKMMEAAGSKSSKLLETQIEMILHVRTAWQQLDALPPSTREMGEGLPGNPVHSSLDQEPETDPDRIRFSQSA